MKKFIVIFFAFIFISNVTFASEKLNIKEFENEVKNYSSEIFPEFSNENWISNVISRRFEIRWSKHI